ncbi:hypothetical protein CERSUDRAFT_87587 [Gelatoporia subvermispora B]|uniref:DUF6699 domain-containing protein n=1 Tax=Ceriporiopsis subvermispora (strain B) TaxID=914234 RepID=M2R4Z3_CERS8|nr:hypothetical protein CERSUDRAFT_87587 [Gelatoporia subvermispora B]
MTISCGICSPPRHTASVATRSIIPPGRINTRRLPPALPSRACRWSFSWVFDVSASNPTAGVSWSDVIDRIHHCLQYYVTYAELDSMPPELKGLVNEAFWYNRSSNPDVPGERLPRAMLRCDWLAFNTMFGGTVRNELAKEQCGPGELTTFELLCFPNTAALEKAARRRYYG